jgi:hypothetical protein
MLTLYCDDSGTHAQSNIAVAACYISSPEQWTEFQRNWAEVNAREAFGVFHMADFVAKQQQFCPAEWADQAKRDRTIRKLINVIRTRAKIGFSVVVVKSEYDEVIVNGKLRGKFGDNHYAFAVRVITVMVDKWRQKQGHKEPVQYVFDRLSKGKGDIEAIFNILLNGGADALRRYGVFRGGWSFEDKAKVVQLQAADIWAWENYRYMRDCIIPSSTAGVAAKKPRKSYLELRRSPVQVKYHVKESLRELVRRAENT